MLTFSLNNLHVGHTTMRYLRHVQEALLFVFKGERLLNLQPDYFPDNEESLL